MAEFFIAPNGNTILTKQPYTVSESRGVIVSTARPNYILTSSDHFNGCFPKTLIVFSSISALAVVGLLGALSVCSHRRVTVIILSLMLWCLVLTVAPPDISTQHALIKQPKPLRSMPCRDILCLTSDVRSLTRYVRLFQSHLSRPFSSVRVS